MFMNVVVFVFGAVIGSFLNVCIFRLPAKMSIVKPSSQCPQCHHPIRWYDNIPLVSFIFCRGYAAIATKRFPGGIHWWN